jgi:hypothetical protein
MDSTILVAAVAVAVAAAAVGVDCCEYRTGSTWYRTVKIEISTGVD